MSLLCTTRYDPSLEAYGWNNAPNGTPSPYLLLAYQLDRLRHSAQLCRWPVFDSLDYAALKEICDSAVHSADGRTPLKVRVVFPPSGNISASAFPVEPLCCDPTAASHFSPDFDTHTRFCPILSISIDTQSTSGTVSMKTTVRQPYDDARARAGIPPLGAPRPRDGTINHPDDVILFNSSGAIMESSVCNVALYRRGSWFTPPLTAGCIAGVFRRWLLENGRIHEADEHFLSLDNIEDDDWVLLFNGVMGCQLGRVHRDRDGLH